MATMIYRNWYSHGGDSWYEPVHDLTRHNGALTGKKEVCEKFMELERAFRTLKLAANAGEDYDIVAARIDKEAARYREFLRNPSRIGKVGLNVKKLKGGLGDFAIREQYHVNEPAQGKDDASEGGASVSYTYQKSDDTVLEFWVYDENDSALFPIARSYTNWVGAKEYDLGLERTFYLDMTETEPGYVKVHAGFQPLLSKQEFECAPQECVTPFSSPVTRIKKWGHRFFSLLFPSRRRLAYLVGFEAVVASIVCCAILWGTPTGLNASGSVQPANLSAQATGILELSGGEEQIQPLYFRQIVLPTQHHMMSSVSGISHSVSLIHAENAWRAAVQDGSKPVTVVVDSSLCNEQSIGCHERWSTVAQNVQSRVAALSHETVKGQNWSDSPGVNLLVSYSPMDWKHGTISFRLRERENVVWDGSQQFDCASQDPSFLVAAFCTEASWQNIADVLGETPPVTLETPLNETVSASQRQNALAQAK